MDSLVCLGSAFNVQRLWHRNDFVEVDGSDAVFGVLFGVIALDGFQNLLKAVVFAEEGYFDRVWASK